MFTRFNILLAFAVLFEGTADLLFRKWGIDRQAATASWMFFAVSMCVYVTGSVCWALSLQFQTVSRGIIAFAVLNVLMVAAAGVWLYGEHLSTVNRIGILLGTLSLVLVEWN